MKKITMQDVAEKAGVSKSTVSQFINKRYEYMAEETKNRIEKSIEELGYVPNYIAKSLKQRKTYTIGVIVANIIHSFSNEIIRSIEDVCEEVNVQVFVCNADDQPEKERRYMEMLIAKQVDGLIILPTGGNMSYYETLKKSNFPIVFIDRKIEPLIYPAFMLDNEKAAIMAIRLLMEKHTKIGVVSTSLEKLVTPRIERLNGFEKAIHELNLPYNEEWIIATDKNNIKNKLEHLYVTRNLQNAFFATNDVSLIELLKFLKEKNISIPNEMAIISIDDSDYLEIASTPITTIKQPTFEIGKDAAKKLLDLMEQEKLNDTYQVKRYMPTVIKRESI